MMVVAAAGGYRRAAKERRESENQMYLAHGAQKFPHHGQTCVVLRIRGRELGRGGLRSVGHVAKQNSRQNKLKVSCRGSPRACFLSSAKTHAPSELFFACRTASAFQLRPSIFANLAAIKPTSSASLPSMAQYNPNNFQDRYMDLREPVRQAMIR